MSKKMLHILLMAICQTILYHKPVRASWADRHPWYKRCMINCELNQSKCLESLQQRSKFAENIDATFGWTCFDECRQLCMWNMTKIYFKQEGIVPKFFGRWPLIRYFGMLEP